MPCTVQKFGMVLWRQRKDRFCKWNGNSKAAALLAQEEHAQA